MPYVYAEFILQNRKSCQVNGFLATFLLYLLEGIWGTHLCKWKKRVFWRLKVMYCYMKKTYDKAATLLIIPSVFSKSYVTRNLTLNAAYTSCLHQLNSYCLTFFQSLLPTNDITIKYPEILTPEWRESCPGMSAFGIEG